ncbi:dTDP-4-dehydrorhamnose reductase [Shewanella glacialipiscicola]|uniref:dTDP-4-dehydrorhamnose reductase n=1 Tax=Shewanella glacialipiscicola TaxID=614069 RepID=A0ABQ6J274_9GAMM|nr:dTDP-4-dehydrorhamnose reductase [Shewanella glacialipiscicola]MCL1085191.1 dTDP-4-dehydrorhamnose reductase [Shewanella glacialipiscicola]GIU13448.1 NAD(P)-dependent oxidoreductase [Shewanella glacialipiscicola]GMA81395.1 NAD(P)-dependent oxidoreductase [Shewanella glacialipiscicola]
MKILIAGKNGQVGRCLVNLLEAQTELTFLALGREELDIADRIQVDKIVSEFQPNIIINAAAYTAVDKAEQESELANAINRDGPHNLAHAANNINAAIIHISTDYVFNGDSIESYTESDTTAPQGEYGRSKLAGEQAVAQACPKHIILRTAWVFGEHGNNFVKTMLRLAKTRESLGVVADQFGGPTYAGDIANAILTISKQIARDSHVYGIYHFSGFPHVNWHTFAEKIFEIALEQNVLVQPIQVNPITTLDYPTPAKRPANSRLNCDKIHNAFGIKQSDWQAALVRIKEYS